MKSGANYRSSFGFTIVELLVVIVVIGILAVITIVSYTGITNRAVITSIQSDLNNASTQLKLDQVLNSGYPNTLNLANGGNGLPSSPGVTYQYAVGNSPDPLSTYCLTATKGAQSYNINHDGALVFGGRNLLKYSGAPDYIGGQGFQQKNIVTEDGKVAMSFTGYNDILYLNNNDLPTMVIGNTYNYSFYAKASSPLNLKSVYLSPSNKNFIPNTPITTSWQKFSFSFVAKDDVTMRIHMYPTINNGDGTYKTYYLSDWKLEEGNTGTCWTPAF